MIVLIIVLLFLAGIVAVAYRRYYPVSPTIYNWETETNLPLIGRNNQYDLMILGTSHGRIFSRFHNHTRVEKILGRHMINLSQGAERGGVITQHAYLSYFYFSRNKVDTVVYFVDPFFFFRKKLDTTADFLLANEPFRRDFLRVARDEGINEKALEEYKDNPSEPVSPPEFEIYFQKRQEKALDQIDEKALEERIRFLYQEPFDESWVREAIGIMMKTIKTAQKHGARVIVIASSTLIPPQQYDERILKAIRAESKKRNFEFYDHSHTITDPSLYYDVDHLNTKGVETFSRTVLKPILDKKP